MSKARHEWGFSPFPREGLVKSYEPFIRNEVEEYCRKYPRVPRTDLLIEAVRLAAVAESKFKPGFRNGNDFSTYLRHYLKGLHRFTEEYRGMVVEVPESAEEKARRLLEERGEQPRPIVFKGGNAARMIFDWQWTFGALVERFRTVFGFQAHGDATGLADRVQELRPILSDRRLDPWLTGVFTAALDHLFRRHRENEAEAEKRAVGDHSPSFFEAERVADVQFPGARQPPKFAPEYVPMLSFDDVGAIDDDGSRLSLHETIPAPQAQPPHEIDDAIRTIDEGRQFMSRAENVAADIAAETIRGAPYDLASLAGRLGMTKSGASKVLDRMLHKVSKKGIR
jgi:hypothetical protein